jgi:hypothetical protein
VNAGAIQQVLVEFVELRRMAEALHGYVLSPETRTGKGVLIFVNEKATWR